MTETWKAVPGFEGLYEVSDQGRVRSLDRVTPQVHFASGKMMHVHRRSRVLKPISYDGYFSVNLYRDGQMIPTPVHRAVAGAFLGPRPQGRVIRHLDGVKTNNTPANLAYGTCKDNSADDMRNGVTRLGERAHNAKLTAPAVQKIRALRGCETQETLADRFGVCQSVISAIQLRKSWKHV